MKKSLKRIHTVLAMNKEDRLCYRHAVNALFNIRLRMALTSFPKVLSWVRRQTPSISEKHISTPDRLAWMIESTGLALPGLLKCLPRALAGFILLRNCGWDVTLKIGARRRDPSLPAEAHAWLERNSNILIGDLPEIEEYAVFEAFEGKFL